MDSTPLSFWIGFNLLVLVLLALDLGVFHRRAHTVQLKEALLWSAFWIALALTFNVGILLWHGTQAAQLFLTGYLLEKALSMDNIFVFVLIFNYFKTPPQFQHRVLFWGVLGALVLRAVFIAAGVQLIHRFEWMIYIFGLVLIYTGVKMGFQSGETVEPEKNPILKFIRRHVPVSMDVSKPAFIVKQAGKWMITPLMVVLIVVETTDVIFAVDSIPAVLGVTTDPFLVFTSNVFAILGLRALYFALAGVVRMFHLLHYGLSIILCFIGLKMLTEDLLPPSLQVPIWASLAFIGVTLIISVGLSLVFPEKKKADETEAEKVPEAVPNRATATNNPFVAG